MRAKIRDTEIYFDIENSGLIIDGPQVREKPTLFIVHGGPGVDHTSTKPTYAPLGRALQLVYFDHRGQGRSARGNPESYTLENNVEDMEALRSYLGVDSIIALGGSYGGMVALAYAAKYGHHLSHLIVVATASHSGFIKCAQSRLKAIGSEAQQTIAEHLWAGTFQSAEHLQEYFQTMGSLYSLTYDPIAGAQALARMILSPTAINVAFSGFLRVLDLRPQLSQIQVPTLVVGARHDWICPPEFSEEIAALIPRAKLKILEASGHSVRADAPEELMAEIERFLGIA